MLIFDAHLDLAMNAVEWNRDLTQPLKKIREDESHLTDRPDRGRGTVCFPEMRRGGVGLCVATQIARVEHNAFSPVQGWRSPAQAWAMTQAQRAWYQAMEAQGELFQIHDRTTLENHLQRVSATTSNAPIGYILSLEGADSLISIEHLEIAYGYGLRAIGPAHYGPGVYTFGTDSNGGFNQRGKELLGAMQRLGIILDVTHLCDEAFWEALELYDGPMWASHSNCRALVPHHRQFSDEQFQALIERGAVIGAALDAWMLVPNWVRRQTTPQSAQVRVQHVVDQIDHVCQLAGNAKHSGIGSDLDGAYGTEQTPLDVESIADLNKILEGLNERGYSSSDVERIAGLNFIDFLRRAWS